MMTLSTRHFVVLIFLLYFIGGTEGTKFLLTVPEKPHYDTHYTATITAYEIYQKETLYLKYRGLKDKSRVLASTKVTFEFDGVKNWTVMFPWDKMESYEENGVILSMSTLFGQEVVKTLYFSKETGFIFIQTDKPLYTPRQTVKFRIIALDEHQRLAKYPLKVDIRNDKQIVVDRIRYSAEDAFKGQELELPKETLPGNWTISANFEGMNYAKSKAHTVSFEVREYVLPRFSASIKISSDVITKITNWIIITVSANYVYGHYTMGTVEMQLGIWDPKTGVKLFPEKYNGTLIKGVYKQDIRVSMLIPKEMFVRANRRLYINVNVTEEGTGENDTIVDTSTFIAHPYYDITYLDSKKHFKPGYPYTLNTQVRARNGRPASWVHLWISAEYKNSYGITLGGRNGSFQLDSDGKNTQDFEIPAEAHTIKFKTFVLDFKAGTNNDNEWTVSKLKSPNNQYLHIALLKPVKKYSDGLIKLRYTRPPMTHSFYYVITRITIMIMAKGHTVFSDSFPRNKTGVSNVIIPKRLYPEVSPSMRIVANFYHAWGDNPEFVIDSLLVKTDDVCQEELSLLPHGGRFASPLPKKPKQKYKLQVKGGPAMHVGMVAVDNAVFLLNDAHTMTRESVFQQFGSHDQGKGSGDGTSMKEVMKNSGLIHLLLDTEEDVSWTSAEKQMLRTEGVDKSVRSYTLNFLDPSGDKEIYNEAPPQTIRNYFPESWLFEEYTLPKSGRLALNLTLPDSITTWSFMAVGLSANQGFCVSRRLQERVQKMFFVDIRLPYKVTRLEEVKVKVAVYNYHTEPISINVRVSGSKGLCFSANRIRDTNHTSTRFKLNIGKKRTKSKDIKIIPLENGELTLHVDAYNLIERDTVERKIYVVAEGLRKRKSLTFVLDPEAKHAKFKRARRHKYMLSDTATMKNVINSKRKTQRTKIDLAMPKEIIRGTEKCKISAFGDLMGDIINRAVIKSKSLMDHPVQNAEEVLGDLGPTVHALLYANQSGLMDKALGERARRFVRHGVARLLRYRNNTAFSLTPKSPPGTWLTAVVLKTLCHATSLAFIDREFLIDHGFYWLLSQITPNETLTERDWRLAKDSRDYQVMLSAEVLISIFECERSDFEELFAPVSNMAFYLEDNLDSIEEPMVLAKVTYALQLFDKESEATEEAVKKLKAISKKNNQGQIYWSSEEVTNESKKVPFWYHKGVKASAIEATAFGLLVFLEHPVMNIDAIADWLVSQRNHHGTFVSALDSMAAIQALSSYSVLKKGVKVDLSCNVTSDKASQHYSHSFKFTTKNAIQPESLNNVPVGHSLQVLTKGQGLGQMQVNVEYNIPIDPNELCIFNFTIEVKRTEVNFFPDMIDDPLCTSCEWNCRPIPKVENTTLDGNFTGNDTSANSTDSANFTTTTPKYEELKLAPPQFPQGSRKRHMHRINKSFSRNRKPRSASNHETASRRSICIKVCLQHIENGSAGFTQVDIDMLTGYLPVTTDIERLRHQSDVLDARYSPETDTVVVVFKEVSDKTPTCIAFRAVDHQEVGRPMPATVTVTEIGAPEPMCALEYHSLSRSESLQVYCADFTRKNRGECRCYSGICSSCKPMTHRETLGYSEIKDLVCNSDVGYQVQVSKVQDRDQWVDIDAKILSVNKTGSHKVKVNDTIKMMSPRTCVCPTFFNNGKEPLYMISTDVEKMVDKYGNIVNKYLLDEQSVFLKVSDPMKPPLSKPHRISPSVSHVFLNQSFKNCPP